MALTIAQRSALEKLSRMKRGSLDFRTGFALRRRGLVDAVSNPKAHGGWQFAITDAGRTAIGAA